MKEINEKLLLYLAHSQWYDYCNDKSAELNTVTHSYQYQCVLVSISLYIVIAMIIHNAVRIQHFSISIIQFLVTVRGQGSLNSINCINKCNANENCCIR